MIGRHASIEPSPALLAAQEKLETLRKQAQAEHDEPNKPVKASKALASLARPAAAKPNTTELGQLLLEQRRRQEAIAQGPRASDSLRAYLRPGSSRPIWPLPTGPQTQNHPETNKQNIRRSSPLHGETVKVYPDIALGMLRQGEAAAGRVWLLLRHLDRNGQGWLRIDIVKQQLTRKNSTLRACGWRQLRKLLNRGEGLFWTRDRDRVWLRSAAKVAAALGVRRLTGKPVATPLAGLLQGMGAVRAHLYASFHNGRAKTAAPVPGAMPVARATLERITGVSRRSQRAYEQRAGIEVQHNFAIGERDSLARTQRRAWLQGQALFGFRDYRGHQGRKGDDYLAWQLPNSYSGCQRQLPKGRQRRINRELADLLNIEMTENGKTVFEKRYYADGKLAVKATNRSPRRDLYWPGPETAGGGHRVWRVVVGLG